MVPAMASTAPDDLDLFDTQVMAVPEPQPVTTRTTKRLSERQLREWISEALHRVLAASSLSLSLGEGARERLLAAVRKHLGERIQTSNEVESVRAQLAVAQQRLSSSEQERLRLNRQLRERLSASAALVEAVLALDESRFAGRHVAEAHAAATTEAEQFFADEAAARATAQALAAEAPVADPQALAAAEDRVALANERAEHAEQRCAVLQAHVAEAEVRATTAETQLAELARIHAASAQACIDALHFGPAPLHRLAGDDAGLRQLAIAVGAPTPDALQPAWWWLDGHGRTVVWQDAAGRAHQASERVGRWWHAAIIEAGEVSGPMQAERQGAGVRVRWGEAQAWLIADGRWSAAG
jgi:hypothetical protein